MKRWLFSLQKEKRESQNCKNYLRTVSFKNSFIYTTIFHLYFTFGSLECKKDENVVFYQPDKCHLNNFLKNVSLRKV